MTTDEPSEFDLLVKFVTAPVRQFGLAIATADHAQTLSDVHARAFAAASKAGRAAVTVDVAVQQPIVDQLVEAAAGGADVVFVTGLERFLLGPHHEPIASPAIEQLNWHRDHLAAKLRARVVLVLLRPAARALAAVARDLDDVVLSRFHFDDAHASDSVLESFSPDLGPEPRAAPAARNRAVSLLRAVLPDLPPDSIGWADAATQAAAHLRRQRTDDDSLVVARQLITRAIQVYEQHDARRDGLAAQLELALIENEIGNSTEALRLLERLVADATDFGDQAAAMTAHWQIARIHLARRRFTDALATLRGEVLPAAERAGDLYAQATALRGTAEALNGLGRAEEALQTLRLAASLYEQIDNTHATAVTLGDIAEVLTALARHDEALATLRDAIARFEQVGAIDNKAIALNLMARNLLAHGRPDEALRIVQEQVLPVFDRTGDYREKAVTLAQIADIHAARGDADASLAALKEALVLFERVGNPRDRAITLSKIADVLTAQGEIEEAIRMRREEVLPIYREAGDVRNLAVGLANHAVTLVQRPTPEHLSEARNSLRDALQLADRIGHRFPDRVRALLAQLERTADG